MNFLFETYGFLYPIILVSGPGDVPSAEIRARRRSVRIGVYDGVVHGSAMFCVRFLIAYARSARLVGLVIGFV